MTRILHCAPELETATTSRACGTRSATGKSMEQHSSNNLFLFSKMCLLWDGVLVTTHMRIWTVRIHCTKWRYNAPRTANASRSAHENSNREFTCLLKDGYNLSSRVSRLSCKGRHVERSSRKTIQHYLSSPLGTSHHVPSETGSHNVFSHSMCCT